MEVNEEDSSGGVDWPLCVPPSRGERSTRMVNMQVRDVSSRSLPVVEDNVGQP